MIITSECINKIQSAARIEEVIEDFVPLRKIGSGLIGKCPKCDADGKSKGKQKGLTVSPAKQLFKCFTCDFHGKFPIEFLKSVKDFSYV